MLTTLLAGIKTSLGKSYLFAGLLPATVFISMIFLYLLGYETFVKIPEFAGSFASGSIASGEGEGSSRAGSNGRDTAKSEKSMPPLANGKPAHGGNFKTIPVIGFIWLSIGIVFFALRTWIFSRFQILPTGRIGYWFVRRSLQNRALSEKKCSLIEWQYTLARWHEKDFSLEEACHALPGMKAPPNLTASTEARKCLSKISCRQKPFYYREPYVLMEGLSALFLTARDQKQNPSQELVQELNAWRQLKSNHEVTETLDKLAEHLRRELAAQLQRSRRYPEGAWIYPTKIGNRLAALDDYADKRYGIPTEVIWNRLWWVLSPSAKQEISDSRLNIEIMLNLSVALLVAAVFIGINLLLYRLSAFVPCIPYFLPKGTSNEGIIRAVTISFLCVMFAIGCYYGAAFAIDALASKIASLIDTNRLKLLNAMGFRPMFRRWPVILIVH